MAQRFQYDAEALAQVVKAEKVEIHYVASDAVIHAAGCQHHADEVHAFEMSRVEADDWFYVAPCAKRRNR